MVNHTVIDTESMSAVLFGYNDHWTGPGTTGGLDNTFLKLFLNNVPDEVPGMIGGAAGFLKDGWIFLGVDGMGAKGATAHFSRAIGDAVGVMLD